MDEILIVSLIITYLVVLVIMIADYIFTSVGLQRIAKRRGIKKRFLVWLPVGYDWVLGSIVDAEEVHKNDYDRKWRKILVIINLINILFGVFLYGVMIYVSLFEMFYHNYYVLESLMVALFPYLIFLMCFAAANTALTTCRLICYYNIYNSSIPKRAIAYMIISLLIPFGRGFCLSRCVPYSEITETVPCETETVE